MAERRGKADGTEDAESSVLPAENATGNYVKILRRLPVKIINLTRNLGGSVGVSFTRTMLQERLQFHHARLAEHVTAYNGFAWNTAAADRRDRSGPGRNHELSRHLLAVGHAGALHLAAGAVPASNAEGSGAGALTWRPATWR